MGWLLCCWCGLSALMVVHRAWAGTCPSDGPGPACGAAPGSGGRISRPCRSGPVRHPRATPGSHAAGHRTPLHRRYRPGHMHEGCRGYRIRRARSTASISGMDAGRRISAARPRHPGAADIASAPHAGRYRWRLAGPPISAGVPLDTDIGHRTGRPGKRYRCGPAAAVGARTDHGMPVPPLIPACASGPRRDADTGLRRGRRYRRMSISECVAVSG